MSRPESEGIGGGRDEGGGRRASPPATQSRSVSETVNGSHVYTIKGYSLSKGMGAGKYMSSEAFTVGGYQWAIYFYPDGKMPEDGALYVSAFIALASDGTDVRALFELTLLDQSGRDKHKVHSHFDRALESGPYSLKYKGSMWGYKRFFRRSTLESSDYIKDDCLVLRCTVGVVRTRIEAPRQLSVAVPPPDLGWCMGKLLEMGVGADVVFEIGDESFRAHKLILAARSPVFRAHFSGLIGHGTTAVSRVAVEDTEAAVFKAMLQYIYTDVLPEAAAISVMLLQQLLAAGDRYKLDRLKLLCEQKLCDGISPSTVAATLALAEQHQCAQLKAACLKCAAIPANLGAVMQTEGFEHLQEACPSILSDLLETIAVVEDNPSPMSLKRGGGSIQGLDLSDGVDTAGRRLRRRL